MGNVFKWFGAMLASVLLAGSAVYAVSWLLPVPESEAQALMRLEAGHPRSGTNGSAALFLLPYDVPLEHAEQLIAPDVARFAATPAVADADAAVFSPAFESFPRLDDKIAPLASFCPLKEAGCLERMRELLPEYERNIDFHERVAARVATLDQYDYFRNPFASRVDMPFPGYQGLTRDLPIHARAFLRGNPAQALEGVCRGAAIARKLVASGDNLIGSMIGVSLMKGNSQLFIDMLAELPADYPVPERCTRAFNADGAMTTGICATMLGEGQYSLGSLQSIREEAANKFGGSGLFFSARKTAARGAFMAIWYCGPSAKAMIEIDEPLRNTASRSPVWSLQCVANAAGCLLTEVNSGYDTYAVRLQDAEMRQKLVASWLWLRGNAGVPGTLKERLAQRPAVMKSRARDIRVSKDGKALEVEMYDDRNEYASWALPVPDWMADPPAG